MEGYLSEKEQWEAIKLWIRENGLWIVAGVAVGAAGIGGYRWYQQYRDQLAMQAGAKYERLSEAFERGDRTQGLVLLGELERESASSPYLDQARMMAARAYVVSGELDKAAKELETVAAHSKDREIVLIARLRLARVQIAEHKPDLALATLNSGPAGAFESRYDEVRGDAYYAKGDKASALKEYLQARAINVAGGPDASELELKISDLAADAGAAKAAAAPPTAAVSK